MPDEHSMHGTVTGFAGREGGPRSTAPRTTADLPPAAEQLVRWTAADLGWQARRLSSAVHAVNRAAEAGSTLELRASLEALVRREAKKEPPRRNFDPLRLVRALNGDPHSLRDAVLGHQTQSLLRSIRGRIAGHDILEVDDLGADTRLRVEGLDAPGAGCLVHVEGPGRFGKRSGGVSIRESRWIDAGTVFDAAAQYLRHPAPRLATGPLERQLARAQWIELERLGGRIGSDWFPAPYPGEFGPLVEWTRSAPPLRQPLRGEREIPGREGIESDPKQIDALLSGAQERSRHPGNPDDMQHLAARAAELQREVGQPDLPPGYRIAESGVAGVPPKYQVLRGEVRGQQFIGIRDSREEAMGLAHLDHSQIQAERANAAARHTPGPSAARR